jgi:hypothetical protein
MLSRGFGTSRISRALHNHPPTCLVEFHFIYGFFGPPRSSVSKSDFQAVSRRESADTVATHPHYRFPNVDTYIFSMSSCLCCFPLDLAV